MIQSLHDIIEKRVADFVGIASSQLPMRVPAALRHRVSEIHGLPVWERLQAPIIAHVGNLKGSFYTTTIASSPDVRHGSVEYTVSGYIHLEESRMSESASSQSSGQEVEFREGCPSVDHVEAALRLGLEWRRPGTTSRYRFVVNNNRVCYDSYPYAADTSCWRHHEKNWLSTTSWRACQDNSDTPVSWSVLDAEVARFKATTTTPPAPAPTQRFNVGDAVMCSTFTDGTAGVRIACANDIARNLGVGKVEGCWQDHSRYRVRNLGTDEVHIWPASALQSVENWGLKVGDEVVTPRFVGKRPSFNEAAMSKYVDKTGKIQSFDDHVNVHNWWWPTYDVAVATAKAKLRKSVEAASSQPAPAQKPVEFRQLTRGVIEANPGQIWQSKEHSDRLYKFAYRNESLLCDFMRLGLAWSDSGPFILCPSADRMKDVFYPICAATKLPMSWDELKPSLDEAKPLTLPRDGDPVTVESMIAVAYEGTRRALEQHLGAGTTAVRIYEDDAQERRVLTNMLTERGATDIKLHRTPGGVLTATYDIANKPPVLHITQEITMPTINTGTTAPTTNNPTTEQSSLLDELKEDTHELGYRLAASETVEITRDVLVDLLTAEVAEREQSLAKDYAREMLSSKAGLALVGLAASFGLPAVAKAVDRGSDPRVLRLARECRREGAMPGLKLLAGKLRSLLVGAGSRLLGVFDKLPAERGGGIEVQELQAAPGTLPAANAAPDFSGSIAASSMRCRTSA